MKYAALGFVVALLLATPATGDSGGIQLSDEIQKKCNDEGGCVLV